MNLTRLSALHMKNAENGKVFSKVLEMNKCVSLYQMVEAYEHQDTSQYGKTDKSLSDESSRQS